MPGQLLKLSVKEGSVAASNHCRSGFANVAGLEGSTGDFGSVKRNEAYKTPQTIKPDISIASSEEMSAFEVNSTLVNRVSIAAECGRQGLWGFLAHRARAGAECLTSMTRAKIRYARRPSGARG